MAFKLAPSPTYRAEVTVEYIGEDGKVVKAKWFAVFNRKNQEQVDDVQERLRKGVLTDDAFLSEVLAGWDGVQDADGSELEFTPENVKAAMNVHPMRPSTIRAWFDSINGARRGN